MSYSTAGFIPMDYLLHSETEKKNKVRDLLDFLHLRESWKELHSVFDSLVLGSIKEDFYSCQRGKVIGPQPWSSFTNPHPYRVHKINTLNSLDWILEDN